MAPHGRESVDPPVTRWDKQQYRDKDRVRWEDEGNQGVRETKPPGELRGQVIENAAGQNAKRQAQKRRGSLASLAPGAVFGTHSGSKLAAAHRPVQATNGRQCERSAPAFTHCIGSADLWRPRYVMASASSGPPSPSAAAARSVKRATWSGE